MVAELLGHAVHRLAHRGANVGELGRAAQVGGGLLADARSHAAGCRACVLARAHLRHTTNTATPQTGVLVAVAPAVDSALDKTTLATQRRVQLGQGPTDSVALALVLQAVAPVLFARAAGTRVDAVVLLELRRQVVGRHRLDIATDRVLHLDAVAGVLESNPLHAVLVLAHNQRCCRRDRAGSGVGVHC